MPTIRTTEELAAFCAEARTKPYVTVDTEFLRERTYYSKLCLIQLAMPPAKDGRAVLVSPIRGDGRAAQTFGFGGATKPVGLAGAHDPCGSAGAHGSS